MRVIDLANERIDHNIETTLSSVKLLTNSVNLQHFSAEEDLYRKYYFLQPNLLKDLQHFRKSHEEYQNIYVFDKDKNLESYSGIVPETQHITDIVERIKDDGEATIYHYKNTEDYFSIVIGLPIYTSENYLVDSNERTQLSGYLFIDSTFDSSKSLYQRDIISETGGYFFFDEKGTVLQTSSHLNVAAHFSKVIKDKILNSEGIKELEIEKVDYFIKAKKSKYNYVISGIAPKKSIVTPSNYIFLLTISLTIISLAFTNLTILYFLRKMLFKPIEILKEAAKDVENGNIKSEIRLHTGDELEELANSVDDMRKSILHNLKNVELSNQKLDQALSHAESAARTKSAFLANMSHEIRTPMNGIIGLTSLLKDSPLNRNQTEYIDLILASANHLLTLINDILDLSKIEHGKTPIKFDSGNLHQIIQEIAGLYIARAMEKGLDINISVDTQIPESLLMDEAKLRQILMNLLNNGIKFTNTGFVFIRAKFLEKTPNNTLVRFSVKDSGIGIDANKQQLIFDRFHQANISSTKEFGGTGLGLSICKELCEILGGELQLVSKQGIGSTFTFDLSFKHTLESHTFTDLLNTYKPQISIFVICDNKNLTDIYQKLAKKLHLDLLGIFSSQEFTNNINNNQIPDAEIVIFDIGMDLESTYINLLKKYRSAEKAQPKAKSAGVICGIYLHNQNARKRLIDVGANIILTRPILDIELVKALNLIAEKKRNNLPLPAFSTGMLYKTSFGRLESNLPLRDIKHYLVVEDDPVNQLIAKKILEKLGGKVTTARNGEDAIKKFGKQKFDLILMDCQMPIIDGYEATQEIRKIELESKLTRTPIIAFTAHAMSYDRDKCLEAGMDEYISKPITENKLASLISDILNR